MDDKGRKKHEPLAIFRSQDPHVRNTYLKLITSRSQLHRQSAIDLIRLNSAATKSPTLKVRWSGTSMIGTLVE